MTDLGTSSPNGSYPPIAVNPLGRQTYGFTH
jgi:hypothetical protein